MCTVGFWKDNHNVYFFKNRDLSSIPTNQHIEINNDGVFIIDDDGKYEGMNSSGLFVAGLTLKPHISQKDYINDIHTLRKNTLLLSCDSIQALNYVIAQHHKNNNFCGSFVIGDKYSIFLIEVMFDNIKYKDLSSEPFFVCTNYSTLIKNQITKDSASFQRLKNAEKIIKKAKNMSDIKDLLKNHDGGKKAICRHEHSITRASYIANPANMTMDICLGHPCENEYTRYDIKRK